MSSVSMNYLAVLVGAIVSVAIGFLWYMPFLFGNAWMQATGKTKEQVEKDFHPSKIVWALVCGFLISYTLARFIDWTGRNTAGGGAFIGLLAGVGFIGAIQLVNDLFEGRPRKLFYVYWLHHLVELVLIGAILGAWM
ncbi:MAG: DUF1761 domain-containing protein [Candidatus Latescibacterota bacterium]|nr:MAG: DUF1761 domain-containing protein [Candidatus Latescibacterota bacterium]